MRSLSAEVWCSKTQQSDISHQQPRSCSCFCKGRICTGAGCENLSWFWSRWMVQSSCSCRSSVSPLWDETETGTPHSVVHNGFSFGNNTEVPHGSMRYCSCTSSWSVSETFFLLHLEGGSSMNPSEIETVWSPGPGDPLQWEKWL